MTMDYHWCWVELRRIGDADINHLMDVVEDKLMNKKY